MLTSLWVRTLPIGRTHTGEKSAQRVRAHSLLLMRYLRFSSSESRIAVISLTLTLEKLIVEFWLRCFYWQLRAIDVADAFGIICSHRGVFVCKNWSRNSTTRFSTAPEEKIMVIYHSKKQESQYRTNNRLWAPVFLALLPILWVLPIGKIWTQTGVPITECSLAQFKRSNQSSLSTDVTLWFGLIKTN